MTLSDSIISEDIFFTQGLINILGSELIDNFFLIVDLDSHELDNLHEKFRTQKNIVAFTSNSLSCYKKYLFYNIKILSKKSSIKVISDYFISHTVGTFPYLISELTGRERQIFKLIIKGVEIHLIAKMLDLSIKTIYTHRRNTMKKLRCENRISFYKLCLRNKGFSNLIQ